MLRFYPYIILLFCFNFQLRAQFLTFNQKNELIVQQRIILENNVAGVINSNNFFVNGVKYKTKYSPALHPFFEDDKWIDGKIIYRNHPIDVRGLRYDIVNDELVYLNIHQNEIYPIILTPAFTQDFYIYNHHFRFLNITARNSDNIIKTGYYEIIHDGNTKFYVKWEKYSYMNEVEHQLEMKIRKTLYIYNANEYSKIKNKRKLIGVLKDKKKEVKDFIRKEKINFSKVNYASSDAILKFYDSLKNDDDN